MKFSYPVLAMALLAMCGGGCVSPRFDRAWQAAETRGTPQRWVGRWDSQGGGAGGRLRALISVPVGGFVDAMFEARWHGFTTAYPVKLEATLHGDSFEINGQHVLKSCIGGGTYTYKGTLARDAFSAKYSSKYDNGTFQLAPLAPQ